MTTASSHSVLLVSWKYLLPPRQSVRTTRRSSFIHRARCVCSRSHLKSNPFSCSLHRSAPWESEQLLGPQNKKEGILLSSPDEQELQAPWKFQDFNRTPHKENLPLGWKTGVIHSQTGEQREFINWTKGFHTRTDAKKLQTKVGPSFEGRQRRRSLPPLVLDNNGVIWGVKGLALEERP